MYKYIHIYKEFQNISHLDIDLNDLLLTHEGHS